MQMVASTSQRDTGAIASARAAEIYGLDVLSEKIQVIFSFLSVYHLNYINLFFLENLLIVEVPLP